MIGRPSLGADGGVSVVLTVSTGGVVVAAAVAAGALVVADALVAGSAELVSRGALAPGVVFFSLFDVARNHNRRPRQELNLRPTA